MLIESPSFPLCSYRSVRALTVLLVALCVCVLDARPASAQADALVDPCAIPGEVRSTRPGAGGPPLEIGVRALVLKVFEINEAAQTFKADAVLGLRWVDPRLSAEARGGSLGHCDLSIEDIWHPDVRAINQRAVVRRLGDRVAIDERGGVTYSQQLLADYSADLDLTEFPFDTQRLAIRVASFAYGHDDIVFIPQRLTVEELPPRDLAGWQMIEDFTEADVPPVVVDDSTFSRLDQVIVMRRKPGYYLLNFALPLCFIVLMAWSVFWLDPQSWVSQIGIATASSFTLIAFLIALRSRLPPVDYLTRMDQLSLFSTMLVFGALGEVILTSRLAQTNRLERARTVDATARWIYLGLFGVVLYSTLVA